MSRTDEYLEASHEIGNYMLSVLHEVCTNLRIRYFLTSGTLLGAVRHEGWIPWDDDVDVIFLREDYERFRTAAPRVLPEDVFFSDGRSNPADHITSIPRLLYTRSRRQHQGRKRVHMTVETRHVAGDLFILDYAPNNRLGAEIWRTVAYFTARGAVARLTTLLDVVRESRLSGARKGMELCAVLASRILSKRRWHELHSYVSSLPARYGCRDVLMSTNYHTPHGRRLRFSANWYGATRDVLFEGMTLSAPVGAEQVLTELFGSDFRVPPPVTDRQPVHLRGGLVAEINGRSWDIDPEA